MNTTPSQHIATDHTPHTNDNLGSRAATVWVSLIVFLIILVALLIFIAQNSIKVKIHYLGYSGTINFGVALLLAAVAGALLAVLIGSIRIIQLKLRVKNHEPTK